MNNISYISVLPHKEEDVTGQIKTAPNVIFPVVSNVDDTLSLSEPHKDVKYYLTNIGDKVIYTNKIIYTSSIEYVKQLHNEEMIFHSRGWWCVHKLAHIESMHTKRAILKEIAFKDKNGKMLYYSAYNCETSYELINYIYELMINRTVDYRYLARFIYERISQLKINKVYTEYVDKFYKDENAINYLDNLLYSINRIFTNENIKYENNFI